MLNLRLVTISHLAKRVLEDNARTSIEAERRPDGTWDVVMSETMADALEKGANEAELSLSDFIIQLRGEAPAEEGVS